jgi:hypothetical protein
LYVISITSSEGLAQSSALAQTEASSSKGAMYVPSIVRRIYREKKVGKR